MSIGPRLPFVSRMLTVFETAARTSPAQMSTPVYSNSLPPLRARQGRPPGPQARAGEAPAAGARAEGRRAEIARRRDDAAMPLALRVLLVVEDEVRVADGAGEHPDARLVHLVAHRRPFAADAGAHFLRDQ